MPTIVAFECADGCVVAADRRVVDGGRVVGTVERTLSFDGCGGAALSGPGTVRRELDTRGREYRTDRGHPPTLEAFVRLATEVTEIVGSPLAVAAREDGRAAVRAVYPDGSVLVDPVVALGTGAELALGRLEAVDPDVALETAAETAADVVAGVAERDSATGEDVDVYRLANG